MSDEKKKSKKKVLLVLIILAICIIGLIAILLFNNVRFTTNIHEISDSFDKIIIDAYNCDVSFELSNDKKCSIEFVEHPDLHCIFDSNDGNLIISTDDHRNWFDNLFVFNTSSKIKVYLPKDKYTYLFINCGRGDISVPDSLTFDSLSIVNESGNVECSADVPGSLSIDNTLGDIRVEKAKVGDVILTNSSGNISVADCESKNIININQVSSDIVLEGIKGKSVVVGCDSGDAFLTDVVTTNNITIENSIGNVVFDKSDSASINVNTKSGDIKGNLISEKIFTANTISGKKSVPDTKAGGECVLMSDSGNIKIEIYSEK